MTNVSSNWQDSLNNRLVNRLTRPLHQPGMIKMAMSRGIINRCDRFLNRVPLLSQQMGRWGNNTNTLSYDAVPIVYAQPVSSPRQQEMVTGKDNVQVSNKSKNQPLVPIIQRKEDFSQVKPVQKDNKTIAVKNLTDLSTSNFSDEKIPSLSLETEINQASISPSEIPLVSSQPISEELANTSEMPLQGKFIDSSNISELNPNISSSSSQQETERINQRSISSSEIPLVSPQPIFEELAKTSEMPLQGKFIDSSNISELNPNISSTLSQQEKKIINQTSISSSEIPLVSPQPISEKLANSEMPLQGKFIDSSNISELNPNISSTSEETKIINQRSTSPSEIPLVSPQPISEELANSEMPLQGKFIDSSNISELNSNISSTSSQQETKIINQTSTSPSEIPLVSPQPISEKLANSEMPLQGKFVDSSNISELNSNISSTSSQEQTKIINQTSTSPSEIPLVSPQPISEELAKSSEMPLQGKFIDSSNISELNSNISSSSSQQETERINQTSISSSEIPVVSPQPISEELAKISEMPLRQEFTSISEQPLPIIKAKQQNSSLSPSSLPLVNPLNTLVPLKQPQQDDNYSTQINSIKQKNLESQISSQKLPIVTTQPLTSQVNFAEKEISFARDELNYQNQSFNISNSQTKPNNTNQNIYPLTTPVISPINSKLKSQPLPLYNSKNTQLSNSINQQPNISNQNSIGANTNSSSFPKIYANPSPPTETSVSTMANKSNSKIDIDAIANKVERKLMRRLVIESERRGKSR
ncbi:hypothetical protein [Okeania sp. SIO2B3]|uniref:hypothetical protein n=1 Tax=Okeania sp. SIO2B3 TaxID=2607784 RepID=UPI0013C17406|nr:hypothetical protein [Okeania sp. SIO2B3]NET46334.1 hypothetical protein [Okeania sp. SIO2B3]